LFLLLPLFIGVVKVENLRKIKKNDSLNIHGNWELVGSFAGVTKYRIYPENERKRFLEAIKNTVMVFTEDGRILSSGKILEDTLTFITKDNIELQKTYEVRNDSLFLKESPSSNPGATPVLSVYVRMTRP